MSELRRFVVSSARLCVLFIAIVGAIVFMPVTNDYFGAFADKIRRLDELPGQRVIAVGGSGLAFGLDSRELERALGRPVVNMGLHAGWGIEFILRHVLPHVRRGDLVIVVPEYGTLDDTHRVDEGLISAVLLADPRATRAELQRSDIAPLLRGFSDVALHRLFVDPAIALQRRLGKRRDYTYSRAGFDAYGDEVGHLRAPSIAMKWSRHIEPHIASGIDELNRFDAAVRARGARAVFFYPSVPESVARENAGALTEIEREVHERLSMQHFGRPPQAIQPDTAFFDTPNHLNAEGRATATARIASALREDASRP